MVILLVTLDDLNPQTTPISTFCVALHIFVVGEHRDFKFGVQINKKCQPTEDKLSGRGVVTSRYSFLAVRRYANDMLYGNSVCLCVCVSYACFVSKRQNISPKFFYHLIAPSF